mgnify:CR=1 FL=1
MGKLKTIIWTIVLLWLVAFLLSKSFLIFSETKMVSEGIAIIEIHSPISVDSSNSLIQSSLSSTQVVSDIEKAEKNLFELLNGKEEGKKHKLVAFKQDVSELIDLEGNPIGPFKEKTVANLPKEIADILFQDGKIEYVDEE